MLHIAAATGHDVMVKMLIAEGAPVAEENKVIRLFEESCFIAYRFVNYVF